LKLFVYGTLTPGSDAWAVLEPWVTGAPEPDAVAGRLYDTGRGYPGATFLSDAHDLGPGGVAHGIVVHGIVVTLARDRADAALVALDRYEGDEYERITVQTLRGLEVATYAWIAPLTGCRAVETGRWGNRPETETRGPDGR
jgi:gamma-glutamylcyclotransferase (GGCT)/AIG2-like uncharacterized protein YtfP